MISHSDSDTAMPHTKPAKPAAVSHNYYIAYTFEDEKGTGFGGLELTVPFCITSGDHVARIARYVEQYKHLTTVVILNWNYLRPVNT